LLGSTAPARAHYAGTALLHLVEQREPGHHLVRFVPSTNMKRAEPVEFSYPAHCQESSGSIRCGASGLHGTITAHDLPRHGEVIVEVTRADGTRWSRVLSRDQPSVLIPARMSAASAASAFVRLGAVHILEGLDHLLFVLGLVLLSGFNRRVIATVTAFTLAHSLSLSLDVLGFLSLSSRPVEAAIALSLLLLAMEVVSPRESLARRHPWSIALGFGLIHGLGFASALRDVGLPDEHRALSLACFNLGVEFGQLAMIAVLYAGALIFWRIRPAAAHVRAARRGLGYAIGGLGAFWFIDRTFDIAGVG
jgi:hydrogenase/urease accessory protein HupE